MIYDDIRGDFIAPDMFVPGKLPGGLFLILVTTVFWLVNNLKYDRFSPV